MKYTKLFIFVMLCSTMSSMLNAASNVSDASALATQTEQLALRLRNNVLEYIMMKGTLTQTFNPFMQEGMFPGLTLTCNKQDNACLDKTFMYTGSCNAQRCNLHVSHLKNTVLGSNPLDRVNYMISMQIPTTGNINLVKRLCFYNSKLGQQVCNVLQTRGWAIKQLGK